MAFATGTFTDASVANAETVIVGGKTYTFETVLTNVDGNVALGADNTAALANLAAAIDVSGVAGTQYAAAMTANTQVLPVSSDATTLVVRAKIAGTLGNQIASTDTAGGGWGAATLAGGTGDVIGDLLAIAEQAPAGIKQAIIDLTLGVDG